MSPTLRGVVVVAAVGCGAIGGVLYAFSSFVMNGLSKLPPAQGIAAMQAINVAAVRPAFLSGLFGTAACCLGLLVPAVRTWHQRPAALLALGSGLYLIGTIGLTAAYHVPLNKALVTLDPDGSTSIARWHSYLSDWTAWNHVRAAAALSAAVMFTLAVPERQ